MSAFLSRNAKGGGGGGLKIGLSWCPVGEECSRERILPDVLLVFYWTKRDVVFNGLFNRFVHVCNPRRHLLFKLFFC